MEGRGSLVERRLTTRVVGSTIPPVGGADGEEDQDCGGEGEREKVDRFELATLRGLELLFLRFAMGAKTFQTTTGNIEWSQNKTESTKTLRAGSYEGYSFQYVDEKVN